MFLEPCGFNMVFQFNGGIGEFHLKTYENTQPLSV